MRNFPQVAYPLTDAEIAEHTKLFGKQSVTEHKGQFYATDELHKCWCCKAVFTSSHELDEEGFCLDCSEDTP